MRHCLSLLCMFTCSPLHGYNYYPYYVKKNIKIKKRNKKSKENLKGKRKEKQREGDTVGGVKRNKRDKCKLTYRDRKRQKEKKKSQFLFPCFLARQLLC